MNLFLPAATGPHMIGDNHWSSCRRTVLSSPATCSETCSRPSLSHSQLLPGLNYSAGYGTCSERPPAHPALIARLRRFNSLTMTNKFTPEEEAEIELMLWEYDRDGKIAIDNFFRREPELALRMVSGVIPKRVRQDLIAFLKQRSRVRRPPL
jgi:hypothetical protein